MLQEKREGREKGKKGERDKKDDQEKQQGCKTASKQRGKVKVGIGGEMLISPPPDVRALPSQQVLTDLALLHLFGTVSVPVKASCRKIQGHSLLERRCFFYSIPAKKTVALQKKTGSRRFQEKSPSPPIISEQKVESEEHPP